jgi:alpha-D-xyloside xylohydrolase
MKIFIENNRLCASFGLAHLIIEAWGNNSLRIRFSPVPHMDENDWALDIKQPAADVKAYIKTRDTTEKWFHGDDVLKHKSEADEGYIENGIISAKLDFEGVLSFYKKGELILSEYWRNRNRIDRYCVPLRIDGREMKPIIGTDNYKLIARFEADKNEKIYGMGQYQDGLLNKKGAILELCHRNSQASVPFYVSSLGYGFLWNNPAIGTCTFGTNYTEWKSECTKKLDYYITAGDTPSQIEFQYSQAVGRTPMMPDFGMGYWQCKLRYRSQDELLNVVREHKKRGLPLDVIVIDFFHWTMQGDFKFEPRDWPDPEAMVKELENLGVKLAVSVWPTIDERSSNFGQMAERGYLVSTDRACGFHMNWMGNTVFYDATNPDAQKFVWEKCKENYYKYGIKCFWLDEAEPEYGPYDFDVFRYFKGPALSCSNIYPKEYAHGFYNGLKESGEKDVMSLVRCAWAGSERYGTLTWSGDISSTWRSFKEQIIAGLSIGMAGIPWWTSDIGGFLGGDAKDPEFLKLLVRWFEFGAFCPVFRMHGERLPYYEREHEFIDNVRQITSGQPNEVWSFGEENYQIMRNYLLLREKLRPYIKDCMKCAHETGAPVMRPLFYDFPSDQLCYAIDNEYMFGPDLLIAPVTSPDEHAIKIYLPEGCSWYPLIIGNKYTISSTKLSSGYINIDAPLCQLPVFIREEASVRIQSILE